MSTCQTCPKILSQSHHKFHHMTCFQKRPFCSNVWLHNPQKPFTLENALSSYFSAIMRCECDVITPTIAITVHCFQRIAVSNDIMVCWMHNDVNSFSFIIMHYFLPFSPVCIVTTVSDVKSFIAIYTHCILLCAFEFRHFIRP